MAERCQDLVTSCTQCFCANPRRGQIPPATRTALPDRPLSVVQLDTLELGANQSEEFHCVLVCIDMFSKWVEVAPLRCHDGESVAEAFVDICTRWGPPEMVRLDNGTEFANAIVRSVFAMFGITIQTGAVRHVPTIARLHVERFNRTLLTLMRKVLSESSDWTADLNTLLYFYRNRPHSAIKVSPMEAISGWKPHQLIADPDQTLPDSDWSRDHSARCARLRDLVEAELSDADRIQVESDPVYHVGDPVLLRRPDRHQKRLPTYEAGWLVTHVLSSSTVVIRRCIPYTVDTLKRWSTLTLSSMTLLLQILMFLVMLIVKMVIAVMMIVMTSWMMMLQVLSTFLYLVQPMTCVAGVYPTSSSTLP